jgi:hypothetical protein
MLDKKQKQIDEGMLRPEGLASLVSGATPDRSYDLAAILRERLTLEEKSLLLASQAEENQTFCVVPSAVDSKFEVRDRLTNNLVSRHEGRANAQQAIILIQALREVRSRAQTQA